MILLGSVVNGGAVVVGGLVGMFVGKLLPERLRTSVMAALSLMTIGIAVPGLLKSNNALIPIISMVVGRWRAGCSTSTACCFPSRSSTAWRPSCLLPPWDWAWRCPA